VNDRTTTRLAVRHRAIVCVERKQKGSGYFCALFGLSRGRSVDSMPSLRAAFSRQTSPPNRRRFTDCRTHARLAFMKSGRRRTRNSNRLASLRSRRSTVPIRFRRILSPAHAGLELGGRLSQGSVAPPALLALGYGLAAATRPECDSSAASAR
jgi:hypothetical protein